MTEDELREIEEREKKATPGPWLAEDYDDVEAIVGIVTSVPGIHRFMLACAVASGCPGSVDRAEADADFIANAREDVPALIAEVRRLREDCHSLDRALVASEWQRMGLGDREEGKPLHPRVRRALEKMLEVDE